MQSNDPSDPFRVPIEPSNGTLPPLRNSIGRLLPSPSSLPSGPSQHNIPSVPPLVHNNPSRRKSISSSSSLRHGGIRRVSDEIELWPFRRSARKNINHRESDSENEEDSNEIYDTDVNHDHDDDDGRNCITKMNQVKRKNQNDENKSIIYDSDEDKNKDNDDQSLENDDDKNEDNDEVEDENNERKQNDGRSLKRRLSGVDNISEKPSNKRGRPRKHFPSGEENDGNISDVSSTNAKKRQNLEDEEKINIENVTTSKRPLDEFIEEGSIALGPEERILNIINKRVERGGRLLYRVVGESGGIDWVRHLLVLLLLFIFVLVNFHFHCYYSLYILHV